MTPLPQIASATEWREAYEALLASGKQATWARDGLAAERRRLPMVEIESGYVFAGPEGERRLIDLSDGCPTLIVYPSSFAADVHGRPEAGCPVRSLLGRTPFGRRGDAFEGRSQTSPYVWRRHAASEPADRQASMTGDGNR